MAIAKISHAGMTGATMRSPRWKTRSGYLNRNVKTDSNAVPTQTPNAERGRLNVFFRHRRRRSALMIYADYCLMVRHRESHKRLPADVRDVLGRQAVQLIVFRLVERQTHHLAL